MKWKKTRGYFVATTYLQRATPYGLECWHSDEIVSITNKMRNEILKGSLWISVIGEKFEKEGGDD